MTKLIYPFALALAVTASAAYANPAPQALPGHVLGQPQTGPVRAVFPYKGPLHDVRGYVRAINGTTITLETRKGIVSLDASYAMQNYQTVPLFAGRGVLVHAALNGKTLFAHDIMREARNPVYWPVDN